MMKVHKLVASVLGIGYLGKGGGTVAAIVYCLAWLLLPAGYQQSNWQLLTAILIVMVGTWSAGIVDSEWGKDSNKVVIDEVAGMAISLLYVPRHIGYVVISLVAFRFFDIVKPLGVRRAESLPKGWGVMADDVLAGLYALFIIQLCILASGKIG